MPQTRSSRHPKLKTSTSPIFKMGPGSRVKSITIQEISTETDIMEFNQFLQKTASLLSKTLTTLQALPISDQKLPPPSRSRISAPLSSFHASSVMAAIGSLPVPAVPAPLSLDCASCLTYVRNTCFSPCMHFVACDRCALKFYHCPICKVPITLISMMM